MKILISNDDGIFSPGIAALVRAFAQAGHEALVCAPDSQRSAASHGLTIGRPITVKETALPGAARAYAIGGTPADCVKLGLMVLCPDAEAVVSGVNCGYNVGTDILYSGTVGAAMEGAISGLPALAISQPETRRDYDCAAALAVEMFDKMMANPMEPLSVLNVNCPEGEIRGVRTAVMEQLHYDEVYTPAQEAGVATYTLGGVINGEKRQCEDYRLLLEGYATVTVLYADLTDHAATNAWGALV